MKTLNRTVQLSLALMLAVFSSGTINIASAQAMEAEASASAPQATTQSQDTEQAVDVAVETKSANVSPTEQQPPAPVEVTATPPEPVVPQQSQSSQLQSQTPQVTPQTVTEDDPCLPDMNLVTRQTTNNEHELCSPEEVKDRKDYNLTSMCKPTDYKGQLRIRNQSATAESFSLVKVGSSMVPITGTIGANNDKLKDVEWTASNDTWRLTIAGFEYTKAIGNNQLCEPKPVTPHTPKEYDFCGTKFDFFKIKSAPGVVYEVDGTERSYDYKIGAYKVYKATGMNHVVTAHAKAGYKIADDAMHSWTLQFSDDDCIEITKEFVGFIDNNENGQTDFGDTAQWKITVTNTADKHHTVKIVVTDETATIEGENEAVIDAGSSVTFNASSTLGEEELAACEVTNTASYMGKYAKHGNGEVMNVSTVKNGDDHHDDTDNHDSKYTFSGSASATQTFDCPAPGQGGAGGEKEENDNLVTPVGTLKNFGQGSAGALPQELPMTGTASNLLSIIGLVMAMLTYAGVYLVQNRRVAASI